MTDTCTLEELFDTIAAIGTVSIYEFEQSSLTDNKKLFSVTITRRANNAKMEVKSDQKGTIREALISAIENANALLPPSRP